MLLKIANVSLKITLTFFLVQLALLLFLSQDVAGLFAYESIFQIVFWFIVISFCFAWFIFYVFLGIFWDKIYEKISNVFLKPVIIGSAFLAGLFSLMAWFFKTAEQFQKTLRDVGVFGLIWLASFFLISFSFSFCSIFIGYKLKNLLIKNKK